MLALHVHGIVAPALALAAPAAEGGAANAEAPAAVEAASRFEREGGDGRDVRRVDDRVRANIEGPLRGADLDRLQSLPSGSSTEKVSSSSVNLPQGPAKVDGLGESFSAQPSTGGATYAIALGLPSGRGLTPPVSIGYASSAGSGLAGVGWEVNWPFIARQTDHGAPRYLRRADGSFGAEQDRFVFGGGEELVALGQVRSGAAAGAPGEAMPAWAENWQYFRARVEAGFLRFFWSPNGLTWRVQRPDGTTIELGAMPDGTDAANAIERHLLTPSRVFRWNAVRIYDRHGEGIDTATPRPTNVVRFAYVRQGGRSLLADAYWMPPAATGDDPNALASYAHHLHFDWSLRVDPSTSFRRGWGIRTGHRLSQATLSTMPTGGAARVLARRHLFTYDDSAGVSLLAAVQVEGRCDTATPENASGVVPPTTCPRMPAQRFAYTHVQAPGAVPVAGHEALGTTLRRLENSPRFSLNETQADLLDLNGDALPDLLVTNPAAFDGAHGLFLQAATAAGQGFAAAAPMTVEPIAGLAGSEAVDTSVLGLGSSNVAPLDADADGRVDLVHMPPFQRMVAYRAERMSGAWRWRGTIVTSDPTQNPNLDFLPRRRETKVLDVDGDGLVDVVVTSGTETRTYFNLGRHAGGYGRFGVARLETSPPTFDPAGVGSCLLWSGSAVRFSDPDVRVADMNGDGLVDIVRIRQGQMLWWPGRGDGHWGTTGPCEPGDFGTDRAVVMENPPFPWSGTEGQFHLGDVTGDGVSGVFTAARGTVTAFDGATGARFEAQPFVGYTGAISLAAGDLTGDGVVDVAITATLNGNTMVFNGATGALIVQFNAFSGHNGPVELAIGDLNGDGANELVAVARRPAGLQVNVYDIANLRVADELTLAAPGGDRFSVAVTDPASGPGNLVISSGGTVAVIDTQARAVRALFDLNATVPDVELDIMGSNILVSAPLAGRTGVMSVSGSTFDVLGTYFADEPPLVV